MIENPVIYQDTTQPITSFTGKYLFLSNYYRSEIIHQSFEAATFPTAQHMYSYLMVFDQESKKRILSTPNPDEVRRIERASLKPLGLNLETGIDMMLLTIKAKFRTQELRSKLVATNPARLENRTWYGDTWWGLRNIVNTEKWTGNNYLGRILELVRWYIVRNKETSLYTTNNYYILYKMMRQESSFEPIKPEQNVKKPQSYTEVWLKNVEF